MPTYEYICNECGDRFDHFQSMSSPALSQRPDCETKGCNVSRVISGGTGLIFKGSGFYLTDYKNKDSKKGNAEDKKKTSKTEKKASSTNKKTKTGETAA